VACHSQSVSLTGLRCWSLRRAARSSHCGRPIGGNETRRAGSRLPHPDRQNHRRPHHRRSARAGGGKGLFTKEIEEALLDGRADLAVHSLKDLPTELPEGLALAAVPEREDARDAVLGKRLADLAAGAASAPARCAAPRSCASCGRMSRSNRYAATWYTPTQARRGRYDAILLAAAGLKRLGWEDRSPRFCRLKRCAPPSAGSAGN